MCTGVEIAYLAAAAVSVAGTAYSVDQARSNANKANDQAQADAAAAQGQAEVEAKKIRDAAKKQQSSAVAALAASGVDVSTGTAEQIQVDIQRRGEEDALTTILGGGRRAAYLDASGQMAQAQAGQFATSSVLSSLSSVAGSYRGWKSTGNGGGGSQPWDLSGTTRGSGD